MRTINNTGIFILGMHRCGASALASLVQAAGVQFGEATSSANSTGPNEWEHPEIVEIHNQLLSRLGSSWDDPCRLPDGRSMDRAFDDLRDRLRTIIDREFSTAAIWGVKDPRLCRLLPFWIPLLQELQICPKFIIVNRHPAEIAAALAERAKMESSKAHLLWLEHMLGAEEATRGFARVFTSYSRILENPAGILATISQTLDLNSLQTAPEAELNSQVDASRRRFRYEETAQLPGCVNEAYAAIAGASATPGELLQKQLAGIRSTLAEAQQLFAPEIRAAATGSQRPGVQYATSLGSQISQIRAHWQATLEALERTRGKLADAREKLDESRNKLDTTKAELHETKRSFAWKLARPVYSIERLLRGKKKQKVKAELSAKENKKSSAGDAAKKKPKSDGSKKRETAAPAAATGDIKQAVSATNLAALRSFLASGGKLTLPAHPQPQVSILMVLFNRAELTFACLRSLAAIREPKLEIIIVDNASTDDTAALLMSLSGATIIHNSENVHFLEGTNQAARAAKGEYLLLLNNDTQVLPNSISAALTTLQSDSSIGAVGAKLILPDGSLQEAGSIIWNDGSCLGYGRGKDPMSPEFQFQRDVDFCSGAFLLTRASLFLQDGGFSEKFKPAYYEETDFCMRLWRQGHRIVYDPNVAILHYEFASSTKSEDAIALQIKNKTAFQEEHSEALQQNHLPPSTANVLAARSRNREKPRVLVIDDQVPHPHLGGGLPRAHAIVTGLLEIGCIVTLYPILVLHQPWGDVYSDIPAEVEVMLDYGKSRFEDFLRERKGYYQILLVSRPHNMKYLEKLRQDSPELFEGVRLIYDAEALFSVREIQRRRVLGETVTEAEIETIVAEEVELVKNADSIIAVSEAERQLFAKHSSAPCYVLGHAIHPEPTPASFHERQGMLFVGLLANDTTPNAESIIWFEEQVFPKIRAQKPLEITVVGNCNAPRINEMNRPEFAVVGGVRDVGPFYNKARVFVAPTRIAAGIPMKVHEAAAYGIPVVTTSLIAQQLGWRDGEHLLVADDPETFAAKCLQLDSDPQLWENLRTNALKQLAIDCAPDRYLTRLREAFLK
jgi:GT2 family glycosyltransferase